HRTRVALTVAAIALSVSLVVAVTSGYASAEGAAYQFLDRFIGRVDAQIARENDSRAAMSEELTTQVAADRDVELVTSRLETEIPMPTSTMSRAAQVIGIRRPEDQRVNRLQ